MNKILDQKELFYLISDIQNKLEIEFINANRKGNIEEVLEKYHYNDNQNTNDYNKSPNVKKLLDILKIRKEKDDKINSFLLDFISSPNNIKKPDIDVLKLINERYFLDKKINFYCKWYLINLIQKGYVSMPEKKNDFVV